MEYASFLAGERWSDHPSCTHPLLAGVARVVNDRISADGRSRLVPLIPSVIGLDGDDPAVHVGIATRCASIALPVVAAERQRALAVGLISAEQVFSDLAEDRPTNVAVNDLLDDAHHALERTPDAARWAVDYAAGWDVSRQPFQKRAAPAIVRVSVVGTSEACIPNPDDMLYEMLTTVIDDCTQWLGHGAADDTLAPSRTEHVSARPHGHGRSLRL